MGSARRRSAGFSLESSPYAVQPRSPRSARHEGQSEMTFSAAEQAAMVRALALAATPGVPLGPNPRVGCVLLDDAGAPVAEGYHRGAGSPHAEADALAEAGERAHGTTAVVT